MNGKKLGETGEPGALSQRAINRAMSRISQTGDSLNAPRRENRKEPTGRKSGSPSDNPIPAISTKINFQE